MKKCPALPLRDRQRALLQFHELPLPDNMAQTSSSHGQNSNQMQNGQKMNLPFAPSKQLSALETLAEVSRQHLDLSGKRMPDKQPAPVHHNSTHAGLLDEFLIHDDRPDGSDLVALSQGMDMSNAPALPSMYQFNGPLHHSPTTSPHMGHVPLSSSASMAQMVPSLVMAASAANDLMPLTNGMAMEPELGMSANGMSTMSDKFFQAQHRGQWANLQASSLDPLLQDHGKDHLGVGNGHLNMGGDLTSKTTAHPRPIAMNPNTQAHFTTDFSMNQKPSKPKVRGRFSDSRRKEVQEVRKRGACIRCRMLKKPCSGDNPCNTCQNVESARLWKQPCIRTRIAEEFSLYSAGLNSVLAYHATNQAKGQIRLDHTSGRIEVTHFLDSAVFATFAPLKCQSQPAQNAEIDPAIFSTGSSSDLEMIDNDDDIGGKLDLYIKRLSACFLDSEDSAFMKVTSQTACDVAAGNAEGLLPKVLELWHFTRILSSKNLEWQIFSNPTLAPTLAMSALSPADTDAVTRTQITRDNHAASFDLIKMQLLGATEKRAACLARVVMNDLERRLLQRQQANPFETFLVAVILLACVERMCWLFRTWETPAETAYTIAGTEPSPQEQVEQDLASALQSASSTPGSKPDLSLHHQVTALPSSLPQRNPRWPFDKPPASFSQQGERFSDILNMLLKMRGVPPKPIPRSTDGVLVMWGEEVDDKVRDWYDGIAVTTQTLDERANARFVGEDSREWELKYVSKIIRGD